MRLAINGMGIAGPTLVYWLRRFGHDPVLFEKSPQLRRGGYLIDFWGVGYELAERMGIISHVLDQAYRMERMRTVPRWAGSSPWSGSVQTPTARGQPSRTEPPIASISWSAPTCASSCSALRRGSIRQMDGPDREWDLDSFDTVSLVRPLDEFVLDEVEETATICSDESSSGFTRPSWTQRPRGRSIRAPEIRVRLRVRARTDRAVGRARAGDHAVASGPRRAACVPPTGTR
jgi:hypothetical protein